MHLKTLNLKLEAEQNETLPSKQKETGLLGDGTDVPMVTGSRGFRYTL
jgi:hypothetical protein